MELIFSNLTAADLRGDSLGELLVHIEADLFVRDEECVIYSERLFPVAELARELMKWINGVDGKQDFLFSSLSFEEKGSVRIVRTSDGWSAGSVFEPNSWSAAVDWQTVRSLVVAFAEDVRRGVAALGLEPSFIPEAGEGDSALFRQKLPRLDGWRVCIDAAGGGQESHCELIHTGPLARVEIELSSGQPAHPIQLILQHLSIQEIDSRQSGDAGLWAATIGELFGTRFPGPERQGNPPRWTSAVNFLAGDINAPLLVCSGSMPARKFQSGHCRAASGEAMCSGHCVRS